jgi:hypothetical protein
MCPQGCLFFCIYLLPTHVAAAALESLQPGRHSGGLLRARCPSRPPVPHSPIISPPSSPHLRTQSDPIPLEGGAIDHWHTQQWLTIERRSSPRSGTGTGATSTDSASLAASAAAAASLSWWRLVQSRDDPSPFNATAGGGLRVVVASDWVFNGIGWNTAQQGGVLAFYGLIVYGAPKGPHAHWASPAITAASPPSEMLLSVCGAGVGWTVLAPLGW